MPRRYQRSTRTLRDQLLKDLEREAQKLLKAMGDDFLKSLEQQAGQALQQSVSRVGSGSGVGGFDFTGSLTRVFGSALTFIFSRPRTSRFTQETKRSKDYEELFRLSRGQAMAETNGALSKGDKNT